jgi:hypothetical protein
VDTAFPKYSIDSQTTAELVFGLMTLVAFVACVWLARKERKVWPLMAFFAGAVMALYEPFNNVLANVAYPQNQHTAFTLFHRQQPVYLVLVYASYFGFTTPWLMWVFERGMTRRQVLQCFAAVVGFAAVFEPLPVHQDWWVYYGEQPLVVLGVPMWWWFANASVVVGSAVLLTLARRHLFTADWQTVLFVPFAVVPLLVWHASAAFPVYAAISGDASMTVKTLASFATIAFAITWAFVMARMIGVPEPQRRAVSDSDRQGNGASARRVPAGVA